MATVEHCLFCFETLSAQLNKRKPMSLDDVQRSYAEFKESKTAASPASSASPASPAAQPASSSLSSATASTTSLSKSSPASAATSTTSVSSAAPSAASLFAATLPTAAPLFVTWNTTEDEPAGEHALRGCIGTFEAQPLAQGLATYALTAALEDSRFPPVARGELKYLEVAVTLLTDFEPAAGVDDWELGKHGLRISFVAGGRRYGATYLPDVAPEQGWTKEETLVSLMRKAGWTGRRSAWRDIDVRVVRYQGAKKSLSYGEFEAWRDWVDQSKKHKV